MTILRSNLKSYFRQQFLPLFLSLSLFSTHLHAAAPMLIEQAGQAEQAPQTDPDRETFMSLVGHLVNILLFAREAESKLSLWQGQPDGLAEYISQLSFRQRHQHHDSTLTSLILLAKDSAEQQQILAQEVFGDNELAPSIVHLLEQNSPNAMPAWTMLSSEFGRGSPVSRASDDHYHAMSLRLEAAYLEAKREITRSLATATFAPGVTLAAPFRGASERAKNIALRLRLFLNRVSSTRSHR